MWSEHTELRCVSNGSDNLIIGRIYRVMAVKMDNGVKVNDGTDDFHPTYKFEEVNNGSSN